MIGNFDSCFDLDKYQSRDVVAIVVIYGGPAISFDNLNAFKQNLFLNKLFDKNIRDFEEFISHHTDPRDWYNNYVHLTSIAVPVWIAAAYDGKVIYNKPILSVENTMNELAALSKGKSIFIYNDKDAISFNRWIFTEKIKGTIPNDIDISVKSLESSCRSGFVYDSLDEHLIALDYSTGEYLNTPHYIYVNAPERIKDACNEKVLSFYKLVQFS